MTPPSTMEIEAEYHQVATTVVLDAIIELSEQIAGLRAEVAELRERVEPAIVAVEEMGPLAEKLATGGLMGLLRPSG